MEQTLTLERRWSRLTLITFRFFFVYFIIFIAPFPLTFVPFGWYIIQPFHTLYFNMTEVLGKMILGAAYVFPQTPNGSGDLIHNYVGLVLSASIAFVATVVWSFVDTRRDNHEKLLYWMLILLRYVLIFNMLSYGFSKVFRLQFSFPSPDQLNRTYGESSPMRLLWTFMGYSASYTIFTGLGEVVGGLLLIFRRTQLLGAIVVAIVMGHVVVLNFSYDVPVKILSMHLLAMAIFIMAADLKRLFNLFILNKSVEAAPIKRPYTDSKTRLAYLTVKSLFVLYLCWITVWPSLNERREVNTILLKANQPETINGRYDVETFIVNNETLSPQATDTRRWKSITINERSIEVVSMDGVGITWHFISNIGYRRAVMHSSDLSTFGKFRFTTDNQILTLEGELNGNMVKVSARKDNVNSFPLLERGFHWVNEYPFNK